ncbi:MAG: hypothetical protein HC841_05330, partial [Verrucomicrobiae bacterium]|nr:hypothetical protein [Verrucomicrobiae bacterium]
MSNTNRFGSLTRLTASALLGVALTDSVGQDLLGWLLPGALSVHHPLGRLGIFCNALVCIVLSALTQDERQHAHRMKFHAFLREHASLPAAK